MSNIDRRAFLGGAAAFAALATTNFGGMPELTAGDPSFMNNVPDRLLSGKELPTFKFELEKSEGKVIGKSVGKEATVLQLPISKGIAGVSMRLEPGAMRELHWHATAAEWAFVLEGRVRTTAIDAFGNAETNEFGPGDVWYFPRGHGHMLQSLGHESAHFVLIFDNGYFSEFGTFSITDWIGHTPKHVLAKNFGLPESAFAGFPKDEVYFARGPIPPERAAPALQGDKAPPLTHKFSLTSRPPYGEFKGGREWIVDSRTFPISTTVTGAIIDLEPGAIRAMHWHPTSDEWQYVIEGTMRETIFGSHGRVRTETFSKGDVGYIPQGYGHYVENIGDKPCRILGGFNAGRFESVDLAQWIAGNPADVLAVNFGKTNALVETFPHKEVVIADKQGRSD
jgi:oxalate decarboxylase